MDAATGQPDAIASSGGSPKPSYVLGEDDHGGSAIEVVQFRDRYDAAEIDPFRNRPERVEVAAGEHQAEVGLRLAEAPHRIEEALVVLVRPRPRGVEQEALATAAVRRERLGVDAERNHPDAFRRDMQVVHDPVPRELADRDHEIGTPSRNLIRESAEEPFSG